MKGALLRFILRIYMSTFRYNLYMDEETARLRDAGKRLVFFCWHNQLLLLLGSRRDMRVVTMISRSSDGDLFAPFVESFGHTVVRASSSRGGSAGLMEMLEHMNKGFHAAMAADGPKGPVYKAKPGVLYLAKKADKIMVPVICNCKRFYRFSSWDRFILPKPFARIDVRLCAPLHIGGSLEKPDVENELTQVQNKIMELTRDYSEDIV